MGKIIIYQIFTRLFGNKNTNLSFDGSVIENGVGKFNDITDLALSEIKKLGITDIWFTGVIKYATTTKYKDIPSNSESIVKGKAGSPYAITDYYDVDPNLAVSIKNRMKEFEKLVERTHNANLRVIIDFVPNHVSRDYHSDIFPEEVFGNNDDSSCSFLPNNNYYYIPNETLQLPNNKSDFKEYPAKVTGNDCFMAYPTENDWYDTVKLNYGVDYENGKVKHFNPIPDTWKKMYKILEFWCLKAVDGFRCDMAEMVPVEFWNWAISKIKLKFPYVKFIAEIYQPTLYKDYINIGKFDFLYDKVGLYDTLRSVIEGNSTANKIKQCWENLNGMDAQMLGFLENHDEQRVASKYFAQNSFMAIPAMLLTATINKGAVMIYFGQEVGEDAVGKSGFSGDDGRTTIFDYWNVPEHQKWMNNGKFDGKQLSNNQRILRKYYKDLLKLCQRKSVSEGSFYDLLWANENSSNINQYIYIYLRYYKTERLLFIVNFNKHLFSGKVKIPTHAFECMKFQKSEYQLKPIFGMGEELTISDDEIIKNGIPFELIENQFVVYKLI